MQLVYDRSAADADKLARIKVRVAYGAATDSEDLYWLMGETIEVVDSAESVLYDIDGLPVTVHEGFLRGAYNYADLNRVGEAVLETAERFIILPVQIEEYLTLNGIAPSAIFVLPYEADTVIVTPKTDWSMPDTMTEEQADIYLMDISLLRSVIDLPTGTPAVPASLENLTIAGANDIEYILAIVNEAITALHEFKNDLIDRAVLSQFYSAEIDSGGE